MRMQSFAYRLNFSDSNMGASLLTEETRSTGIPFWNNFVRRHWWNQCSNSEFGSGAKGGWPRVPTSDDLRRYCANCITFAERVSDPADKTRLIEMAQAFLELAWKEEQKDFQPTED
jgi:hypothetical protein